MNNWGRIITAMVNPMYLNGEINYDKAKELIKLMVDKFGKEKLPFTSVESEKYFRDFFIQVDQNYR